MAVTISHVSFEHYRVALGIAEPKPRISWRFGGNPSNWTQTSYDLEIKRDGDDVQVCYHVNSSQSTFVPWPAPPLATGQSATIRVRAHGRDGQPSTAWSYAVAVEPGLLNTTDWAGATVIASEQPTEQHGPHRPLYFRKFFSLAATVKSARLYITALGIYDAELNGQRVGDYVLSPGWQSYQHRHVYDTYDVTSMVRAGGNAIGVHVGEGWFLGNIGFDGGIRNIYGDTIGLLSLLVVTYMDGRRELIPTDETWSSNVGATVSSEIYVGESYDSRLEQHGWSTAPFSPDEPWLGVKALPSLLGKLSPPTGPQVRRIEERKVTCAFKSRSGKTVLDFGQNLVGWIRLHGEGPRGQKVTMVHTEVMENDEVATRPLRIAYQTDSFIFSGEGVQTWEPRFTFHGFRYVQIEGWPDDTPLDETSITAIVVHSDLEETGWFECSNHLLNKFHENVRWSMKGNFLSIPTDCPQRDERLGWTGDAHLFAPVANFLYDTAGFWRGWFQDLKSEQFADSSCIVPFVIPTFDHKETPYPIAIWSDVSVGGPWENYLAFGDTKVLQEQHPSSKAWLEKGLPRNDVGLWDRTTYQFGDWLDPLSPPDRPGDATTDKYLVADAYLVRMTEIMARINTVLNYADEATKYENWHIELKKAFQNSWIDKQGRMANETQTAYALALGFNLFRDETEEGMGLACLRRIIRENGHLVGTGFGGTAILPYALSTRGATEDFYKMLLQTKVPSWLYQVKMGGTTTWERWDSLKPDGSVNPGEMTSFNHYSFGSISNWIHSVIGGISPRAAGWKEITIAPVPGGNITRADTKHMTPYGLVQAKWWFDSCDDADESHNVFHLMVRVPPNTKGYLTLPSFGGKAQDVIEIGSGYHKYQVPVGTGTGELI